MHDAETGRVTGVDDLFGSGRIEPGRRLDRQDEDGVVAEGKLQRPCRVTDGNDGFMGARRQAEADTHAGLVHNPDFFVFDRYGIGGADAHTRQARDAQLRVDPEIHEHSGRALENSWIAELSGVNLSRIL